MSPTNFLSICHFPTDISSLTSSRIHRSFQYVTLTKLQLLTLYSKLPTVRAHISTTCSNPGLQPLTRLCFSHLPFIAISTAPDFSAFSPSQTHYRSHSLFSRSCKIPSLTLSSVAVLFTCTTHFNLVDSGFIRSVC